ncbi:MAG TPA: hypothetical protein DFR83_09965 [Deltaproteobacteria bacterium]|nr:hypothetical protein [Deltaproteobacteria bacterium]
MNRHIHDFIQTFRSEIAECDTERPIFHGCWDWHSSVHAHWALLESAHLVQDEDSLEWVLNRLQNQSMLEEIQYLQDHPTFEMPYGRAWFLRLMMRLEQITGFDQYTELVQAIADNLHHNLKSSVHSPLISEYQNPSWAFIQLYHWASHVNDKDTMQWIRGTTEEQFLHPKAILDVDREGRGEFFSLWGLQVYLIYTVLGAEVLKHWLEKIPNLEVIQNLKTEHHLAIHASRAWGLYSAYSATSDQVWKEAYDRHLQASIELHPVWKVDRRAYAHWVPQFTLYAILMNL